MEDITISLSNDTDTPTFYQTLAGVTHCKSNIINKYIYHILVVDKDKILPCNKTLSFA